MSWEEDSDEFVSPDSGRVTGRICIRCAGTLFKTSPTCPHCGADVTRMALEEKERPPSRSKVLQKARAEAFGDDDEVTVLHHGGKGGGGHLRKAARAAPPRPMAREGVRSALRRLTLRRHEGIGDMHCVRGKLSDPRGEPVLAQLFAVAESDVAIEICHVRPSGWRLGAKLLLTPSEEFEVLFRLLATEATETRIEIRTLEESEHSLSATIPSTFVTEARQARVAPLAVPSEPEEPDTTWPSGPEEPDANHDKPEPSGRVEPDESKHAWSAAIEDPGTRRVFLHIAEHGVITEEEVVRMVGGQRGARRFARAFESHALHVPFEVRIESVAGVKRYTRVGGTADLTKGGA